ncbi:MAG: Cu(I)-responsive transcriptional regulator [Rhodobacteraceae bacterium]|nr:MAG: Cu(I)-responsive transcriptional regulator [Paracoccaceae bacterium]
MNIGDIAKRADLPTKTVRYYADQGLVNPAGRNAAGYRIYDAKALRKLIFVRRARAMGFSIKECKKLLGLYEDQSRASADVRKIAAERLAEVTVKLEELSKLKEELTLLVNNCHGDNRPDCPILESLEKDA